MINIIGLTNANFRNFIEVAITATGHGGRAV
jgi:hypothetical protein